MISLDTEMDFPRREIRAVRDRVARKGSRAKLNQEKASESFTGAGVDCPVEDPGSCRKRSAGMNSSGYPGVSWNKRMQAWLAFYYDGTTRRSRTFSPKSLGGDTEGARIAAIAFRKSVENRKKQSTPGAQGLSQNVKRPDANETWRNKLCDQADECPNKDSNFLPINTTISNTTLMADTTKRTKRESSNVPAVSVVLDNCCNNSSSDEAHKHFLLPSTSHCGEYSQTEEVDLLSIVADRFIAGKPPSLWMQSAAGDLDATNLCCRDSESNRESILMRLSRSNTADTAAGWMYLGRLDSCEALSAEGKISPDTSKEQPNFLSFDSISEQHGHYGQSADLMSRFSGSIGEVNVREWVYKVNIQEGLSDPNHLQHKYEEALDPVASLQNAVTNMKSDIGGTNLFTNESSNCAQGNLNAHMNFL